jgi:hypothetical protein
MKRVMVMFFIVLGAFFYTETYAQKPAVVTGNEPGWKHIGQTTASFKMQNESIAVLGADEFTALKLKVSEAKLHIERLQVFYESGDMEDIDVRKHFSAGTESRVINLKHPDRDIKKVSFTYRTDPNVTGEKADVALWGLKTNQPAGADTYRKDAVKEDVRETRDEVRDEARETEKEIENDGVSAGDKIEEGAKDAAAAITDQKLDNKVGPGNETVYVDENAKYYYINNEGEKVFITKLQLRDKPKD